VRDEETFVDGSSLGNTITRIAIDTSRSTSRVERKYGLDSNVHGGNIEGLEHDLGHLFSVDLGVKRSLSQENWVLIWGDSELDVESVVPDLLHIIPVLDDTVLNGVGDLEDPSLLLCLVTEVLVLALNTDENVEVEVLGSSDDGRENASGAILT
jgi:hypothetical protein